MTEEWLRDAYLVRKMDCTQIAHVVNRDPKSVWNWLRGFGIKTRPRGSNVSQLHNGSSPFKGKHHTEECKQRLKLIAKKDGRVPFDPSVGSYMKGRKGKDTPNWKGGLTPERQSFYSSRAWGIAVKQVWQRDNAICQRCGLDHRTILRGTIRFHIHHIDSFSISERRADVTNLVLLCEGCHKWIHSRKNRKGEFLGNGH